MAFGYEAHYGYFPNGIISGTTKIGDMVLTDTGKWFVVAETATTPTGVFEDVSIDLAHERISTITDWAGITLIPHKVYNTGSQQYSLGLAEAIKLLLPSAFRECPGLLAVAVDPSHYQQYPSCRSAVYMPGVDKVIASASGASTYRVTSDGTLIATDVDSSTGWRADTGIGGSGPASNTSISLDFYVSGKGELDGKGYLCSVYVTESELYRVFSDNTGHYTTEFLPATWESKRTTTFGTGDPEWNRNPFDTDPYNPLNPGAGGPSKPGGGGGSYDFDPENVVPITDPNDLVNLTNTDLISVYSPTNSQLAELATYLWDDSFFQSLIKIKNDPFDVIIGLHIVPVPLSGSSHTVKLGNVTTTIQMKKVSSQFYKKSCGGIMLDEIWGAYLDYMCRIQLFLPFIGFVSISPDDVFGHIISVDYVVDAITGGCVAFIRRDNECIATYGGNCAYQIPLTGANYANISSAIIGAVVTGVGAVAGVATGGLAAPLAATAIAGASINTATAKPEYQRSGALTANIGYMGMRTPYLLIYAPNQCVPEMQNTIKGYPAWITRSLGAVHGYTEVDTVHLDGITATDAEKEDIMAKLKAGVIL